VEREGIRTPGLLIANSGENKPRQGAHDPLSYFHGPLLGIVWQAGFLFVFSVQFDGEKPDKITRGACAVTTTKSFSRISELDNPEFYFREAEGVRNGPATSGSPVAKLSCEARPRKTQRGGALCPGPKLPVGRLIGADTDTWYKLASSNETDRPKRFTSSRFPLLVARRKTPQARGTSANLSRGLSLRSKPE